MNQFLTQYFITYNMKKGWFLTESPILTADWIAPAHNRRLGGIGKITRVGKQPIVWQVNLYYNVIGPQDIPSPKWQVRLQVALLYPNESDISRWKLGSPHALINTDELFRGCRHERQDRLRSHGTIRKCG